MDALGASLRNLGGVMGLARALGGVGRAERLPAGEGTPARDAQDVLWGLPTRYESSVQTGPALWFEGPTPRDSINAARQHLAFVHTDAERDRRTIYRNGDEYYIHRYCPAWIIGSRDVVTERKRFLRRPTQELRTELLAVAFYGGERLLRLSVDAKAWRERQEALQQTPPVQEMAEEADKDTRWLDFPTAQGLGFVALSTEARGQNGALGCEVVAEAKLHEDGALSDEMVSAYGVASHLQRMREDFHLAA